MYWEVNGNAVNTQAAANAGLSIQGDKAYYHNLYGNISAEYVMLIAKRELNYLIPTAKDLGIVPQNAKYLVFYEEVILPSGWKSYATQKGIEIKNTQGKLVYLYSNPVSHDAAQTLERTANTIYESYQTGNVLSVKTKVETAWLLDSRRKFPVKVDPTVNVTPNNTTNWTRGAAANGYDYGSTLAIGHDGNYFVRSFFKFNSSSIPSSAVVSAAKGYVYVTTGYVAWNGQWQFANSVDPTANSGTTLYNSATTGYSASFSMPSPVNAWKSIAFSNPAGYTYIQNQLTNNYILASATPTGSWSSGQYYLIANHTNSNRK